MSAAEVSATERERKRCDTLIAMLWVDLVNMGLADERHAQAFDRRREQIRRGIEL